MDIYASSARSNRGEYQSLGEGEAPQIPRREFPCPAMRQPACSFSRDAARTSRRGLRPGISNRVVPVVDPPDDHVHLPPVFRRRPIRGRRISVSRPIPVYFSDQAYGRRRRSRVVAAESAVTRIAPSAGHRRWSRSRSASAINAPSAPALPASTRPLAEVTKKRTVARCSPHRGS